MVTFEGEQADLGQMNILGALLLRQALAALEFWPEIEREASAMAIPVEALLAVGSRETNLSPTWVTIPGDQGHGHGLWQLDDRWHMIPASFPVARQAEIAASMLAASRDKGWTWRMTFNAYNSGSTLDEDTTGGDYGPDVLARAAYLWENLPHLDTTEKGWIMADSPVAQDIIERLERLEDLIDHRDSTEGGRLMWRVGQLLNMVQRQMELGALKRPPDYVEWHQREEAWHRDRTVPGSQSGGSR